MANELILSDVLKKLAILLCTRYEEADRAVTKSEIRRLRDEVDLLNKAGLANGKYIEQIKEAAMIIIDILNIFHLLAANPSDYLRRTGVLIGIQISRENLASNIENLNLLLVDIRDKGERYDIKDYLFAVTMLPVRRHLITADEDLLSYDMETEDLTNVLIEGRESRRSVVAVLGGRRTGKSSLAARIYNSQVAAERFEIRVWVAVPHSVDDFGDILRQILRREDERGVEAVRELLNGKRYLIMLDNVWSDELWHVMRDVLPDDCVGSKVVVTTRREAAAVSFVETTSDQIYRMKKRSPVKLSRMTKFRRLNLAMRAMVRLRSTKLKLKRAASTSSSFVSDGPLSFFSDDIED